VAAEPGKDAPGIQTQQWITEHTARHSQWAVCRSRGHGSLSRSDAAEFEQCLFERGNILFALSDCRPADAVAMIVLVAGSRMWDDVERLESHG